LRIRSACLYIFAIAIGVAASVGGIESRLLFWSCISAAAVAAVLATLTLEPVGRFIGWPMGAALPRLTVTFDISDVAETLTFSVREEPVTELVVEPLSQATDAQILMDPHTVRFLEPGRPVTCSILVEEGTGQESMLTGLQFLLEHKRSGKIQVVLRFTDAKRRRKRIPFAVEVMGAHHEVVWVPGREEGASPDW
jgi:hypothetical protein